MGWRRKRSAVRFLRAVMALYLAASGIELLDRSGVADEYAMVNDAAETLREVRAGSDPTGVIDEIETAIETVRRLADSFREASEAIDRDPS